MRAVFLPLLFAGSLAHAAFNNENSLLIGDRSAGMGGAAVAVTGDAAGSPYYNPGTLAFLEGQAFSAAVGIYKKFDTMYGEEGDFTRASLRVNQGFFRALPASTGSVVRWEKVPEWTFAFSVVVPDYEQYKGDLRNNETNVSTLTFTDESLWVGGSMSRKITPSTSWGATFYYTARSYARSITDRSFPSTTENQLFTQEKTVTENALVAIVGYYSEAPAPLSWGVSARLPSLRIAGRATMFESETKASGGTVTTTNNNAPEKSVRVVIPGKIQAGIAYRPDESWILSADASLREGVGYNDLEDSNLAVPVQHRAVWNVGVGAEKIVFDWLKLRSGVYTNFSSQPDPDADLQRLQEDHVDMVGFSANAVFVAGQKISYTFGGYYGGGRGRSVQRIDQKYVEVPKSTHIFTMLVGTSFSF